MVTEPTFPQMTSAWAHRAQDDIKKCFDLVPFTSVLEHKPASL